MIDSFRLVIVGSCWLPSIFFYVSVIGDVCTYCVFSLFLDGDERLRQLMLQRYYIKIKKMDGVLIFLSDQMFDQMLQVAERTILL